jgi:hypothetical protein
MEHEYVDELFEKYIDALVRAKTWQTVAAQYSRGDIPGPTLDSARKPHLQALEPLLSEYKKARRLGSAPEQALQSLRIEMRDL